MIPVWPSGDYKETRSIRVGSSSGARALFTSSDTGHCRNAAIWSLLGEKRKSEPAPEMTRLTRFDISRPPFAVLHNAPVNGKFPR